MSTPPHKGWKGCQLCKPHKNHALPLSERPKHGVKRQLGGKVHRVTKRVDLREHL